jgi:hypothetical protein
VIWYKLQLILTYALCTGWCTQQRTTDTQWRHKSNWNLKFWANVADKICLGRTYKFSAVQWRQFPHRASVVSAHIYSAKLPKQAYYSITLPPTLHTMHYWVVVLRLSHCTRGIPLLLSAMYDHRVVTKYYVLSWVKSNSRQQHFSLPETMLQCSHYVHCWHSVAPLYCLLVNFAPFIRYGDLDYFLFPSFLFCFAMKSCS